MNRILFLFFLFAYSAGAIHAQNDTIPLVTQIFLTKNDTVFKSIFLYNNKKKSLETKYYKVDTDWMRYEQTEWVIVNDLCSNIYFKKWINNQWQQTYQINFDRLGDVLQTETHFEFINGSPVYKSKKTYKYRNNLLDYTLEYIWAGSMWQFDKKTAYHYNVLDQNDTTTYTQYQNNKISSISRTVNEFLGTRTASVMLQTENDTVWDNITQTNYYYDPTLDKVNYEVKKDWDTITRAWVNNQNTTYIYRPDGNLIKEIYQTWKFQFWKNDLSYTYEYDGSGKLIGKTTNLPIYRDFRPQSKVSYSEFRYEKPMLVEAVYDFWGALAGDSINTFLPYQFNAEQAVAFGSKLHISYLPVDNTGTTTIFGNAKEILNIYPNPSKDIFYYNAAKYNIESWKIMDVTGKVVMTNNNPGNSGIIDLGDTKSGVYILIAKTKTKTLSQKLIKL